MVASAGGSLMISPMKLLKITLCATFAIGFLSACATGSSPQKGEREDSIPTRVMTFNIHHALGMDGRLDLDRVAQVIKKAKPDIVCIQEIHRRTLASDGVDQFEELSRLLDMRAAFGAVRKLEHGEAGLAIFTKWNIGSSEMKMLPADRDACALLMASVRRPGDVVSSLIVATTQLDGKSADVRLRQVRSLKTLLAAFQAATGRSSAETILAGDLSTGPASGEIQLLSEGWRDTGAIARRPTCPANGPVVEWDYILYQPANGFRIKSRQVLDEPFASSHRPVLAVLEWTGASDPSPNHE